MSEHSSVHTRYVIFIEPAFPANQREFVRALHRVGAQVIGIGERHRDALDGPLASWMLHYEQVGSVVDEGALAWAVHQTQQRVPVHRLEATVEAHVMAAARVRERCGIPGTSTRTAFLCRDKPAMKEVLRAADVPCADSLGSGDPGAIRAFAARTGYPVVLKPRAAAGASGTYRADGAAALDELLEQLGVGRGADIAVEEFVEGHEAFYDTLTIDGRVVHDFVTHYYPNVLEAMRTRWISPQFITTNRIDSAPHYAEVRALGARAIQLLGIGTSATHMEWFFGPKGLRFSEIACRPPGVGAWDLYCMANEIDLYHDWAMAVVHGRTVATPSRRFAAGLIALRPERDGQVTGYDGLDDVQRRFGQWIVDAHLPPPGSPTQPVEAGYMANAWIRLRHPDYDELRAMMNAVGETVRMRAA